MYTVIQGPHGTRYKKDARFCKKADIPADILIKLQRGMDNVDETPKEPEIHKCIFCGQVTKQFKLLNQQAIYICTDDYYDKTTGQIVQQLNKEASHG